MRATDSNARSYPNVLDGQSPLTVIVRVWSADTHVSQNETWGTRRVAWATRQKVSENTNHSYSGGHESFVKKVSGGHEFIRAAKSFNLTCASAPEVSPSATPSAIAKNQKLGKGVFREMSGAEGASLQCGRRTVPLLAKHARNGASDSTYVAGEVGHPPTLWKELLSTCRCGHVVNDSQLRTTASAHRSACSFERDSPSLTAFFS